MDKIKILNVITNGFKAEGITSSWLAVSEQLFLEKDIKFEINYLVIEDLSDYELIKTWEKKGVKFQYIKSRNKNPFKYIFQLKKILQNGNYDIIHVNGSSHLMTLEFIAAKLSNIKLRIAHSRNTSTNHNILHKVLSFPFNKLVNGRIACGKEAGDWLFGKHPFTIIHNGRNLTKYSFLYDQRTLIRKDLMLEDKFIVGHIGNFNDQKNHKFLIDIFHELVKFKNNAHLVLIGDGPLFYQVKNKINNLGLNKNVTLLGSTQDIPKFLQAMDLMVFPSLYEGLPNVVLEWQANGLPSLISDSITKECIVSDFVYTQSLKNSPKDWAEKILEIYKKGNNRMQNSIEGIKALKNEGFDIKATITNLQEFYISFYFIHKH